MAILDNLPLCHAFVMQIVNQAIFYQLREVSPGGNVQGIGIGVLPDWGPERKLLPSNALLNRFFVGIRFRAAVPLASIPAGSNQAIVQVECITV